MYTEKEARDKWCPQARIVFKTNTWATSVNRGEMTADEDDTISVCIGSKCMEWRWDYKLTLSTDKIHADGPISPPIKVRTGKGYCGLGGKPCQ